MNVIGMIILAAIGAGAFAMTMAAISVGRGECGGRCTGCGKCGKSSPPRQAPRAPGAGKTER